MTVVAVSMVKDEVDVIESTVRRMAAQVDGLIIADNGSTDGTLEVLYDLADELPLDVLEDRDPAYYQSRKMSALAVLARDAGAEWVVPFDADECWGAGGEGRVADVLATVPDEALIVEATLCDHVPTAQDPDEEDPIRRIGWRRRQPAPLRKVAVRAWEGLTIHQGNHGASYEGVEHPLTVTGLLRVAHFPYRSPEQMVRKARNGAAAYAATDLGDDVGAHWRGYGRIVEEQGEEALHEVFRTWFWSPDPEADPELVHDPVGDT